MKKLVILLIVLAALVGVAMLVQDKSGQKFKPAPGREKLLAGLDVNAVKKIRIKDHEKTATLVLKGETWTVAERSDYPAAFEKLGKALLDLREQKAGKQTTVGKAAWGRVKLNAPGEGTKEQSGTQVELIGEGDKVLHTIVIGGSQSTNTVGKEASPFGGGGGHLVRVNGDGDSTVWIVDNEFYDLTPRAEDWIEKTFISVQDPKEVEVTATKPEDSWKAARTEAAGDFKLADAKAGEELDAAKVSLGSILSSAMFNDVLPKDKATADFMKDATKARITTFDGFTYLLQMLKKTVDGSEKDYVVVTISADIPKERPPVKDEKPEDKKKADDEFAAKKKAKEEKLAAEKKCEGWVFEVSSYTIDALMKKRSEVLKAKEAAAQPGAAPAPAPGAPPAPPAIIPQAPPTPVPATAKAPAPAAATKAKSTPITVTTPPVSVPPVKSPAPAPPTAPQPPKVQPPSASPTPAAPPPAPAKAPEEPKK